MSFTWHFELKKWLHDRVICTDVTSPQRCGITVHAIPTLIMISVGGVLTPKTSCRLTAGNEVGKYLRVQRGIAIMHVKCPTAEVRSGSAWSEPPPSLLYLFINLSLFFFLFFFFGGGGGGGALTKCTKRENVAFVHDCITFLLYQNHSEGDNYILIIYVSFGTYLYFLFIISHTFISIYSIYK